MYQSPQPQYPIDRIIVNQFNINGMLPNIHPRNVPQHILVHVPTIIRGLITVIINRHQQNPLRTYLLNQMGQQDFTNNAFANLVEYATKLLEIKIARNQQVTIEAICEMACEHLAAFNVANDPVLDSILDYNTKMGVQQALAAYQSAFNEIEQYVRAMTNPTMVGGYGGGMGYGSPVNPIAQSISSGMSSASSRYASSTPSGFPTSGLFSNNAPASVIPNKFQEYNNRNNTQANPVFNNPIAVKSTPVQSTDNLHISNINNWNSSKELKEHSIDCAIPLPLGNIMDRNRHFRTPQYQQKSIVLPEPKEIIAVDKNEEFLFFISDDSVTSDNTYNTQIMNSDIAMRQSNDLVVMPGMMHAYIVSKEDLEPLKTYIMQIELELKDRTLQSLTDVDIFISRNYKDSIVRSIVNKRLTDAVNNFLKMKLGLIVRIDSFKDDILDLPEYLKNNFGKIFSDKLNDPESLSYIYNNSIYLLIDEVSDELKDKHLFQNKDLSILFFSDSYYLTGVNKLSNEFQFDIKDDNSVSVKIDTPELHNLLEQYFDFVDKDDSLSKDSKHYIRFIDGEMFEVSKSSITDIKLISIWK